MSISTTVPAEIGAMAADAIRETVKKTLSGTTIASYIEGESPVSWDALAEAGWDLVGIVEDDESATLRDLVEIAQAWGESLVQLPLIPSLIAKRHNEAAIEWDGPVTFSVPAKTVGPGRGFIPFGQVPGIGIITSTTSEPTELQGTPDEDFAPSLRASSADFVTEFGPELARDLCVTLAGEASGIAKRVVRDSVEFAKQREQFGRPIGSFQAVKHHLANAHIAAEEAETAAIQASLDEGSWAHASLYGIGRAIRSVELGTQVHGGLGITWEMGLHFYLRHLISLRDMVKGVTDA